MSLHFRDVAEDLGMLFVDTDLRNLITDDIIDEEKMEIIYASGITFLVIFVYLK